MTPPPDVQRASRRGWAKDAALGAGALSVGFAAVFFFNGQPAGHLWVVSAGGGRLGGEQALWAIENLQEVAGLSPRLRAWVQVDGKAGAVQVEGLSPLREAAVSVLPSPLASGRTLSAEPGFELVLTPLGAQLLGGRVGVTMTLRTEVGFDAFSVVGISQVQPAELHGWVHIADLQGLVGDDSALDLLEVVPASGVTADALKGAIERALPGGGIQVVPAREGGAQREGRAIDTSP